MIIMQALHTLTDYLLLPVIVLLFACAALCLFEIGLSVGEAFRGTKRLTTYKPEALEALARKRIGRTDIVARIGPSLGLMGTLIPLGPGIAALGRGDFMTLSQAVNTAFDTTVLGLTVGLISFILSRYRRNHYENILNLMEKA